MDTTATQGSPVHGTALAPNFYQGPTDITGDVHLNQRFFAYRLGTALVAGKTFSVMFTIDRPAKDVWRYLKDFNLWQNAYGHYYSGIPGELEGERFHISDKPNGPGVKLYSVVTFHYNVLRAIPENMMVFVQTLPEELVAAGMKPDCHVFLLHEYGGKTIVTIMMEHAALYKSGTEEESLHSWREMATESQRKWRDIFIPTLRKLIEAGSAVNA